MKEKKIYLFIILGMAVSLLGIAGASYSLYKSSPRGKTVGAIANWNFKVNGASSTFAINLAVGAKNTVDGKLAPGSYGSFTMNLDATGTDTDVNYQITFKNVKGKPNNMKFYLDKDYTTEINLDGGTIKDTIAFGEDMRKNVTIYWNWDNTTKDNVYQGSTISFDIIIVGSQKI